jgi:UDP-N-acetylenolpyruvoylglucosamine reductase
MPDVMELSTDQMFGELKSLLAPSTLLKKDEPLARKTTMRIGGPADAYVEPASEDELSKIIRFCRQRDVPFFMLGRGSNLLIRDGGIRGVVICLSHPNFSKLEIVGERLVCGAGVKLKNVSVEARRNNLAGLEFLEGIPGSVGGALRMNAGAMGVATFDVVEKLRYMDLVGEIHEVIRNEVVVNYRSCPLLKENIALGAVFKGTATPADVIAEKMKTFSNKRWDSQPAAPSAGCIFKNITTIPAGKLVDELGLKGTRVGGAVVSDVHGNFIVNEGNATAQDVLNLIELIKEKARSARGLDLQTEVEIIGSDPVR